MGTIWGHSHTMATIARRENGKWQAKIRRTGAPAISKTFATKVDAERWARATERDLDTGSFLPTDEADKTTFSDALDRYRCEALPSQRGRTQAETRLRRLDESFGKYSLSAISGAMISKYRDERLQAVSAQTVVHEIGQLQRIFKRAVQDWGIQLPKGIPTLNVSKPRLPAGRDRRLEGGEETALLEQASKLEQPWVKAVVILAIETAARQSELLSLTWDQVDLTKRIARLRGIGGGPTKNGSPYRDIPLSSRAAAALNDLPRSIDKKVFPLTQNALQLSWERLCRSARKTHLLLRLNDELAANGVSEADAATEIRALIFKKKQPSKLTLEKWENMEKSEKFLRDLHFHDLRHEGTSRLAEKLQMHELMKVTGHKSSAMLDRYYHPRAEDLAAKLD